MGLGELYESQFKNFLGIGENKNEKLKAEIMDSFKELNYFLDSLSNFSFVPHPTKSNGKKGQTEAIVVEEKVPLTLWNGQR
jgi:U3 small nucleolar ribonucleoprotein component